MKPPGCLGSLSSRTSALSLFLGFAVTIVSLLKNLDRLKKSSKSIVITFTFKATGLKETTSHPVGVTGSFKRVPLVNVRLHQQHVLKLQQKKPDRYHQTLPSYGQLTCSVKI